MTPPKNPRKQPTPPPHALCTPCNDLIHFFPDDSPDLQNAKKPHCATFAREILGLPTHYNTASAGDFRYGTGGGHRVIRDSKSLS